MENKTEAGRGIVADGFFFRDKQAAEQAQREAEGVKFIQEKIDRSQPRMVLQVYNQVVRQNMFETVVGQTYLKDLQEYLKAVPEIQPDEILPIQVEQVRHTVVLTPPKKEEPKEQVVTRVKHKDYKKSFQMSFILNIALIVCIIFMFLINLSSDSPTILNYENKLIDKYVQWEEELEEREQILRERENAQQ